MGRPGRARALDDDLAMLRDAGITLLVSLTVVPTDAEIAKRFGIEVAHIPIADFTPPTPEQIDRFVTLVADTKTRGGATVVHCAAGKGRTGTMLAAYLVACGSSGPKAIERVREQRPGSIETEEQERAVLSYRRTAESR
jgi:atypical dual specificity phosphatase